MATVSIQTFLSNTFASGFSGISGFSGFSGVSGFSGTPGAGAPKAVSIGNPTAAEDVTVFFTPQAITVSRVQGVVLGTATPYATVNLRYDSNRANTGTLIVSAANVNSTTTGTSLTLTGNTSVAANSYIWIETTATGGTVNELSITVDY